MLGRIGGPVWAAMFLLACQPAALAPDRMGPAAPAGTPAVRDAVDGLQVGHRLMTAGEYDLALRAYYRAASEVGVNADVLSAIGSANLKLGRLGQAEQYLRRAIEADQRFVPAHNNLGVVLMERGRIGEARRVFQVAFALDSGASPEIRENLRRAIAAQETRTQPDIAPQPLRLLRRGPADVLLLGTPEDAAP
jgi:Flp pilus assembly protein TadD